MRVLGKPRGLMPYSNHGLPEHELTGYHNQERTMWSIGMIILELFVGTNVVKCLRTHHDVIDLVTHISYSLGQRLYDLIGGLLFKVSFNIIKLTLDNGLLDDSARVKLVLREVAERVKHSA